MLGAGSLIPYIHAIARQTTPTRNRMLPTSEVRHPNTCTQAGEACTGRAQLIVPDRPSPRGTIGQIECSSAASGKIHAAHNVPCLYGFGHQKLRGQLMRQKGCNYISHRLTDALAGGNGSFVFFNPHKSSVVSFGTSTRGLIRHTFRQTLRS